MALDDTLTYDGLAQQLGLDQAEQPATKLSNFWADLNGDDLGAAIVDRFQRFRQWQSSNGLLKGWRLKLHYYTNEYRADPEVPHLSVMQQWGSQGEYQFVTVNHLRSLLKTVMSTVVQNPPTFQTKAVNADADSLEAAALYQGVLDFYARELSLTKKINKAVETGVVIDQGFILIEWNPMAVDGDQPQDSSIWRGAPSVRVLSPWDICYDVTRASWSDLDYVIVRDWCSKQLLKESYPEFADDIDGCAVRSQIVHSYGELEGNTRYAMSTMPDMSDDIQLFKLFFKPTPYLPQGRFVMCLENGKLIYESPAGLVYPKLPVERFTCDDCIDVLLGYSPINELLGPQEAVNSLVSAITTNANNYANQYVAVAAGTDLNPRILGDGQKVLEYPPGTNPPSGLNLTAIPPTLFSHLENLMKYMQVVPGVSNASRGEAPGANSTGSAMLFLASQTTANQGSMSDNYAQFSAAVMTSLLHVLRTFARTERTVQIMGTTVASRTIVIADALKGFDNVVVDQTNPILSTPQGKMQWAQQLMQWGQATAMQAQQVATSGNLGPAVDPAREAQFSLDLENEALLMGKAVQVFALDDHEAHVMQHKRLLNTPWIRQPDLAEKLGLTQAPQVLQAIMNHINEHMQMLQGNMQNQAAMGGGPPGAIPPPQSAVMGHAQPPPGPAPGASPMAPAQGQAVAAHTQMPGPPGPPQQPTMPGPH